MKFYFYSCLILLILYEFLNHYFVMGYPGSQDLNSLALSHTLHYYKVWFEIAILLAIAVPATRIFKSGSKIAPSISIIITLFFYVLFNFKLTAENRFRQPIHLNFETAGISSVDRNMHIVGVEFNGKSKAYAVPYIRYHHQIIDSIGGKKIIVTYCGICRTGRIYEPYINGEYTLFRLVGINHYNAMLEDEKTKSWWSQETGVCIAGKLKGTKLNEVNSSNMILQKWVELYPETEIMQPDLAFARKYRYEDDFIRNVENPYKHQKGGVWSARTFVIGVSIDTLSKAYEWTYLVTKRIIIDKIGNTGYIIVISNDNKSFTAFENPEKSYASLRNDTIFINDIPYNFAGTNLITSQKELKTIKAYREYWFSWVYAHPNTEKFSD